MKKNLRFILYLLLLFSCFYDVKAQGHKEGIFNFSPDTTAGSSNSFIYAEQNYFFAAGQADVDSNSSLTVYLAKFDYNLKLQKEKYLSFAGLYNRCWGPNNGIAKISDNRYVFLGIEQDDHSNSRVEVAQPYLYFFNSNLSELGYSKYVDTVRSRYPYSIAVDKQKNILVCGFVTSKELHFNSWDHSWYPDSSSLWVAKYDSTGVTIWQKEYNTLSDIDGAPTAFRILLGNDSASYIVAGLTTIIPGTTGNFIMKLDTSGRVQWTSYLPRPYSTIYDIDLAATGKNGYAFISSYSTKPGPVGSYDDPYFYYGRIKENGDTLWTKLFRNCNCSTYGNSICVTDNNDLLLLGSHDDTSSRPTLIRTDSNGNVKWYREYYYRHPLLNTQLVNFSVTPDKRILLCGQFTNHFLFPGVMDSVGNWSLFIMTDTFGCIENDCQIGDTVWRNLSVPAPANVDARIKIYPNPAQERLFIQTGAIPDNSEAELMDISGRLLYRLKLKANTKEEIEVGNLEPGLYLLQVWVNGVIVKTYEVSKVE